MPYQNKPIPPELQDQLANLRYLAEYSADLLVNPVKIGGISCALIGCEGMLSTTILTELVLQPLMSIPPQQNSQALFTHIQQEMLLSMDRPTVWNYDDLFRLLHSGFAILFAEGETKALAFGVQGYEKRSINEPSGEANLLGSHEGFTEAIRTNMSMLRRRMKTPLLKFELSSMGSLSKTDICLCWLTDRVPPELLQDIRNSLESAQLETVLSAGYIQPFLEQNRNFFDTVSTTERPDVLAAKLLEGRVAILIDGNPFALVVPKLFVESFQTLDDYNFKPWYACFLRWVKYGAFLLALLLPALYVAVSVHHPEMLNRTLLLLLSHAEADEPLSLPMEAIEVLLMYEVIREAGLRLPKAVGGAVGLIGGLIIGDAAVASGLISTPMLTMAAISVTAGFIIPDLNSVITVLRIAFILAGGFWGLFGIGLLGMVVLLRICSAEDYGFPITAPISPFYRKGMRDVITRVNFRQMQSGNFTVEEYHEQD